MPDYALPCYCLYPTFSKSLTVYLLSRMQPQPAIQSPALLFHPPTPMIPPSSACGSTDHFRKARQLNSLSHPCSHISIPVHAIMAALSVQSSWGGKSSFTCSKPRASRKARSLRISQLSSAVGSGWATKYRGSLRP